MSEVIVHGGNGFIGRHLVEGLKHEKLKDFIVNLAAMSDVQESIDNPTMVIRNNVDCLLYALEANRKKKLPFIQFSTVEVYESASPYAASKAAQEAICTAYSKTYGMPMIITTTNNVVGPGQKGKFIPQLVEKIKAGKMVDIYITTGEMGYRTYNPVQNVVDALIFIMNRPVNGLTRYHLSGGQELSNLEMAQKVADKLGKPLKYRLVEADKIRPGYTRHLQSDGRRLEDLGWRPPVTLDQGLAWLT